MAVIETVIKTQISQLLASTAKMPPAESADAFASGLATIITNAIRSGTVNIPPSTIGILTSTGPATNPLPVVGTIT